MWITVAVTSVALAQQTDTTFAVRPTARLEVYNHGGGITVRTWTRNAVRLEATHSDRDRIEVSGSESAVSIRTASGEQSQVISYRLTVPREMALNLTGVNTSIAVEGVGGEVTAETVEGHISVRGGRGFVSLTSVEGDVVLEGASARVRAQSVDGDVTIAGSSGEISAETVDGDILLDEIESSLVEAKVVDGDVHYDGTIRDNGRYRLSTHDGDIRVTIPPGANVTVSGRTFSGEFQSTFPITFNERTQRRFKFRLGSGSATLEVESFDGTIQLHRPGELPQPPDHEER